MLIRSQDKKAIIAMENSCCIFIRPFGDGKYFVDANFAGKRGVTLAIYSTEEKAIKVLDMIENFYSNLQYTRFVGSDYAEFFDIIFQMPQDDEVQG